MLLLAWASQELVVKDKKAQDDSGLPMDENGLDLSRATSRSISPHFPGRRVTDS